ncbi:MAG: ribonuclease P protein component [Sporomusaceae bacterium]|nr:ribonuclease P protein component [Sporomusaceae bacterium]
MDKEKTFFLKKAHLLRKNKEFQFVYRCGKSVANRFAVLYVMKNSSVDRRAGFVTGKRLGGAVVRNRVKRLFKEAYRLNQSKLKHGFDLIVIGRGPVVGQGQATVTKAFLDLCKRAKILLDEERRQS